MYFSLAHIITCMNTYPPLTHRTAVSSIIKESQLCRGGGRRRTHEQRIEVVRKLWATHGVEQQVVQSRSNSRQVIINSYY